MTKEIAEKIIERGSVVGRLSESIQLAENYLALEQENERLREVVKAIGSINRGRNNLVPESVTGDDEPCYWQREEWINWILELADKALQTPDKEGE